jgi:hypothetical protein
MYGITGGLEVTNNNTDVKLMNINGINYVVSDKFRTSLRDIFIDWGTFLEIYHDNLDYALLFNQIIKLLNIKENENLREHLIPVIDKIYNLPLYTHMICMMKQFIIYEPVSLAIHELFVTIKLYYENIIEKYVNTRNEYIDKNNLKDEKNNFSELKTYWSNLNEQHNLDSSSIILLFLNPPLGLKSNLNITVTNVEETYKLKQNLKLFKYKGFCIKVPHERLKALLEFPIDDFINSIVALNGDIKIPDFNKIETMIKNHIKKTPDEIKIEDNYKRSKPPKNLSQIELAKWYIEAILTMRKNLLPYGSKFEEYYVNKANIFNNINLDLKNELKL